jgi:predicted NBD/HSP70 family sugar kinase
LNEYKNEGEMKAGLRTSAQTAIVRAVHGQPGVTRAQVATEIGIPSGFAAETVTRLVAARLVTEAPAPATGMRGRPTTALRAHPDGPLVAAAAISHDTWQVAAVEIGAGMIASVSGEHDRDQDSVLSTVTAALDRMTARFGPRVRAAAVAVPGTVAGNRLVYAPNLAWSDVDLSALWPHYEPGREFLAGNDATFAGVAEARHGAGAGAGELVYLHLDAGIGGTVVEAGRAMRGTTGAAGEFGHMPFGHPLRRCRCGAIGCLNASVDGRAIARLLHQRVPADDVGYTRGVLASARAGQRDEIAAIRVVAGYLGRAIAGLVNGFDPHAVVFGGLGPQLLQLAAADVTAAYHRGLMSHRATPPPPVVPGRLGVDAALLGAADEAFDLLLTDEGLQAWTAA